MLVTQQPVWRRFWYAIRPMHQLQAGPQPFTLLGEKIVLWKRADGTPAALRDRCCQRAAQLSKGFVDGDPIVCGYRGWTCDCSGSCVRKTGFSNAHFFLPLAPRTRSSPLVSGL